MRVFSLMGLYTTIKSSLGCFGLHNVDTWRGKHGGVGTRSYVHRHTSTSNTLESNTSGDKVYDYRIVVNAVQAMMNPFREAPS